MARGGRPGRDLLVARSKSRAIQLRRDLPSCRRGSRLESDPILLLAAARPEPGIVLDRSGLPI